MMKLFFAVVLLLAIQAEATTIQELRNLLKSLPSHQARAIPPVAPAPRPVPGMDYHMPGFQDCNYIEDFIRDALYRPMTMDMIDEFDYMPEYSERVRYVMERFRDVEDFDAIALLATRNVTRGIFRDRMLCPATMLEMFAMKYIRRSNYERMISDDFWMYKELLPVLATIPHIETSSYTPEFLARQIVMEIHERLFNDTLEWMMTKSISDVNDFARWFFHSMKLDLPYIRSLEPLPMHDYIETFLRDNIWKVYCPMESDVLERLHDAEWELKYGLGEVETYEVCTGVRDFMKMYLPETVMYGDDQTKLDEVIEKICDMVHKYMMELVEKLPEYIEMIEMRNPTFFIEQITPFFTDSTEMGILTAVLERLGWTGPPGIPKPVLTVADVIAHEEEDVAHWNKWLTTLTPEMDLNTLKRFVELWLESKRDRIDTYYNHGPENPIYK